jgi:hypothetical protein
MQKFIIKICFRSDSGENTLYPPLLKLKNQIPYFLKPTKNILKTNFSKTCRTMCFGIYEVYNKYEVFGSKFCIYRVRRCAEGISDNEA